MCIIASMYLEDLEGINDNNKRESKEDFELRKLLYVPSSEMQELIKKAAKRVVVEISVWNMYKSNMN